MRLAVVGSRGFKNKHYLYEKLDDFDPEEIISGGAAGADSLAEKYARDMDIELKIFLPDHKQYRHAYHHRNRLIVERCDELVAFWDGKSTGTKYTITYARRMGKPVHIFKY